MGLLSTVFNTISDVCYLAKKVIRQAKVIVQGVLRDIFQTALNLLNDVIDRLEAKIDAKIEGAAHFFRQVGDVFQEGTKNYFIDTELGDWHETIVTRVVGLSAVPEKYLPLLEGDNEYNDTLELQNAIEC